MSIKNKNMELIEETTTANKLQSKNNFIAKRRTPYLMQKEIIEMKRLKKHEDKCDNAGLLNADKSGNRDNHKISAQPQPEKTNLTKEISRLYGLQKKIIHFFVKCCLNRDENKTGPVTADILCSITGSTKKTIKKIIQRLIDNHMIDRVIGKRGRGGFSEFILTQEVINIVQLQINLERDHASLSDHHSNTNIENSNNSSGLPQDWQKIDLTILLEAFKSLTLKNTQYFGKSQLKIIYSSAGNNLTSSDVQDSINAFAYGLKNYPTDEPYISMANPGAVLLEKLKNGDKWIEEKYLTEKESLIYEMYLVLMKNIDINNCFFKWLSNDKEKKYEFYKSQMRPEAFYDQKVFEEKAFEDYKNTVWAIDKKSIVREALKFVDKNIIDKLDILNQKLKYSA